MTLDQIIELHMREHGELSAVGQALANDNRDLAPEDRPPDNRLLTRVLANGSAIESHVTDGLGKLLDALGASDTFKAVMREFMQPVVALAQDTSSRVLAHTKGKEVVDLER